MFHLLLLWFKGNDSTFSSSNCYFSEPVNFLYSHYTSFACSFNAFDENLDGNLTAIPYVNVANISIKEPPPPALIVNVFIKYCALTVLFFFCFQAAGQHCDLCLCHHRGRHVILHGWQEASEGLFGGKAVSGGQTQPGGAEPATGQRSNITAFCIFTSGVLSLCSESEGWIQHHLTGCSKDLV